MQIVLPSPYRRRSILRGTSRVRSQNAISCTGRGILSHVLPKTRFHAQAEGVFKPRSRQNEISSTNTRDVSHVRAKTQFPAQAEGEDCKEPLGEICPKRLRIMVNRSLWEAFWEGLQNLESLSLSRVHTKTIKTCESSWK